jgi:hypothetical protein
MNGSVLDKAFDDKVSLLIRLPEGSFDKLKARFPMTEINHSL